MNSVRILLLSTLLISIDCLAVGWEVLDNEAIEKYGIHVTIEADKSKQCSKVKALFPENIAFEGTVSHKLEEIEYSLIKTPKKWGWELDKQGLRIELPLTSKNNLIESGRLCLTMEGIEHGYLRAMYLLERSPPVLLYVPIKLVSHEI